MIYQESIGETKTTYDGTPEEIAELYSKLNLPEELPDKPFIIQRELKEQSEPVNINITVNGEVDAEKISKEMNQKAKEVFKEISSLDKPYFAKEEDAETIKILKDK